MIKIYCRTNLDGYETETWPNGHIFCVSSIGK